MEELNVLTQKAKDLRKSILDLGVEHKDGHIAPAYSCVEMVVALYDQILGEDDKFILSKGHACLVLFSVLKNKGMNPRISGHPDIQINEGVECTTGSLGHGFPIGLGMAFARKLLDKPGHIYVMMGDGECQEGSIWESANLARKYKLDNLTIIVDHNKYQALTTVDDVMNDVNLAKKFEAFGGNVIEIDGHDFNEVLRSLSSDSIVPGKIRIVVANTIKGKGVSFMENVPKWHAKLPEGEELEKAYKELE
ncbi:transketolase [Nanoarchaeota archaeon]